MTFTPFSYAALDVLMPYFAHPREASSEASLATVYGWADALHTMFAVVDGDVIFRFRVDGRQAFALLPGGDDLRPAVERMLALAHAEGIPFWMPGVSEGFFRRIDDALPGRWRFTPERDLWEYLFLRERLATLRGKSLASKRNHVHHFERTFRWDVTPLCADDLPLCLSVFERWASAPERAARADDLAAERRALTLQFSVFERLRLRGLLLRVDDAVGGFALGERVGDTLLVHAEKVVPEFREAYALLCREEARLMGADCLWVNREEDMGLPSLRAAKMQWHPDDFIRKGSLTLI